VLSNQKHIN